MELLQLPEEVFQKVILYSVISREVKRALRMKLVCKKFYICFQLALFESHLLDEFGIDPRNNDLKFMELWYIRKNHGTEKLWQSFLVYRVKNETDPAIGRFVEIRKVAEDICHQTESEYEETVNSLCWLALERGTYCPNYREGWNSTGLRENEASNPGLNLLSAAAYLGHIHLARRLLSEGNCPTADNHIFPSPIQLAAWVGNFDMVQLFQEHLPEFEELAPRYPLDDNWRGKTGPGSIKGAVLHGDMDMIRLAVYPPSRSTSDSTNFSGQPFGLVDPKTLQGSDLQAALYCVKTWEAFQYIDAFFKESILLSDVARTLLLARYAELGNVEIVQHLLDAGADIHGGGTASNCNPLVIAARFYQEDIVDLLLERGADPNNHAMQQRGSPLCAATAAGSLSIVRKLLDHGATVDKNTSWLITNAVKLEHTALVEFLLDSSIGSAEFWSSALREALTDGLDSMAELLQQRGITA